MDYLPFITNPAYPPIEVPYLGGADYIWQGFHDYPKTRIVDEEELLAGDLQGRSVEELEAFLQQWLYFGPLHEICDIVGMDFVSNQFVRETPDGQKLVSTAHLPTYVETWDKLRRAIWGPSGRVTAGQ